jgi:hypothetical protein
MAIVNLGASTSVSTSSSGSASTTIPAAQSGFSAGGVLESIRKGAGAVGGGILTAVEKTAEFIKQDEVQNLLEIKRTLDTLGGAGGGGMAPLPPVPPVGGGPRMDLAGASAPISRERKGLLAARAPDIDETGGTRLFQTTPGGPEVFGERSPGFDRTPTGEPAEDRFDLTDAIAAGVRGAGRGVLNLAEAGLGQPISTGGGDPTILQKGLGAVSDVVSSTLGFTPPSVIAGEEDPAPPTGRERFFGGVADISGAIQGRTPQSTIRANQKLREQEAERAQRRVELAEFAETRAVTREARQVRGEKREERGAERAEIDLRRKMRADQRDVIQDAQTAIKAGLDEASRTRDPEVRAAILEKTRAVVNALDPSGNLEPLVDFAEVNPAYQIPASFDEYVEIFPELDFVLRTEGPEGVGKFLAKDTTQKRLLQVNDQELIGNINWKLNNGIEYVKANLEDLYEKLAPGGFSMAEFLEAHDQVPAMMQLTPAELDSFQRNPGTYAQIIRLEDVTTAVQKKREGRELTSVQVKKNNEIGFAEDALLSAIHGGEDPNAPGAARRKRTFEKLLLGRGVDNKQVELMFSLAMQSKFALTEEAQAAEVDRKRAFLQEIGIILPDHLQDKFDKGGEFSRGEIREGIEFTAEAYGIDVPFLKKVKKALGKKEKGPVSEAGPGLTGASAREQFPRTAEVFSGPAELPPRQEDLKVGTVYELADGRIVKYTGTGFLAVDEQGEEARVPSSDVVTPEEASRIVRGIEHTIQAPGAR